MDRKRNRVTFETRQPKHDDASVVVRVRTWGDKSTQVEATIRGVGVAEMRAFEGRYHSPMIVEPENFDVKDFAAFAWICERFADIAKNGAVASYWLVVADENPIELVRGEDF